MKILADAMLVIIIATIVGAFILIGASIVLVVMNL